jgi:hypothetical protein
MAGPWERYQTQEQPQSGPWTKYAPATDAAAPEAPSHGPAVSSAIVVPRSMDAEGRTFWDWDAGLVGAAKRAIQLPGQVYRGEVPTQEVDPVTGKVRTSQDLIERTTEAAGLGTTLSPASKIARTMVKPAVKSPTAEQLRKAGGEGYDKARAMGVDYSASAVGELATCLKSDMEADGIFADLAPKSFRILEKLAEPPVAEPGESVVASLAGLDAARKALRNARLDFNNPTEKLAAERIIRRLDDFIEKPDPKGVVAGPAAAAGKTLTDARGNIAAAKRSEKLTLAEERAELNAAVANSGANLDNAIRQRARDILTRPKERAGFSKGELQLIEAVARGKAGRNTLRFVGNLLGGGGGMAAAINIGMGAGGGAMIANAPGAIVGASLPLVGAGMKQGAAQLTKRGLRQADEAVRKRSPLYERMQAETPSVPVSTAKQSAMLKALLSTMANPPRTAEEQAKQSMLQEMLLGQPAL